MAKSRLTGGAMHFPDYPKTLIRHTSAPSTEAASSAITLAAATDRGIIVGQVKWADGATHSVEKVRFRTGTQVAVVAHTLRVYLADIDLTNGPPARDDGTPDQSATQVDPASNTTYELTFGATRSVTHGEQLAVVFDFSAYTSGSSRILGAAASSNVSTRPQVTYYNGSVYATFISSLPFVTLIASDGTFGIIDGMLPCLNSTTYTSHAINTGTTPDEVAIAFTVPTRQWGAEIRIPISAAADASYEVVLYSGTTAQQTIVVDADTFNADASPRWQSFCFPDVAFVPGTTYYATIKPTTANSVTIYSMLFGTTGERAAYAGTAHYAERVDAGAWTPTTTRVPVGSVGVVATDDGTIPTGSFALSGTVTLDAAGVENATVRVIDRTTGQVSTDTTDVNGDWSISVESDDADRYAALAEYESGGTTYQALAPWALTAAAP